MKNIKAFFCILFILLSLNIKLAYAGCEGCYCCAWHVWCNAPCDKRWGFYTFWWGCCDPQIDTAIDIAVNKVENAVTTAVHDTEHAITTVVHDIEHVVTTAVHDIDKGIEDLEYYTEPIRNGDVGVAMSCLAPVGEAALDILLTEAGVQNCDNLLKALQFDAGIKCYIKVFEALPGEINQVVNTVSSLLKQVHSNNWDQACTITKDSSFNDLTKIGGVFSYYCCQGNTFNSQIQDLMHHWNLVPYVIPTINMGCGVFNWYYNRYGQYLLEGACSASSQ